MITDLRRNLLAGEKMTTALTGITLDADSVAVKVTSANTVLQTALITAGCSCCLCYCSYNC
jgi:hypothetical protein